MIEKDGQVLDRAERAAVQTWSPKESKAKVYTDRSWTKLHAQETWTLTLGFDETLSDHGR